MPAAKAPPEATCCRPRLPVQLSQRQFGRKASSHLPAQTICPAHRTSRRISVPTTPSSPFAPHPSAYRTLFTATGSLGLAAQAREAYRQQLWGQ